MIVTGEIYQKIASPKKFVPILRKGSPIESMPSYLKSKLFMDFRNDNMFDSKFEELIRHIYDSPKFTRPPLGMRPSLEIEERVSSPKSPGRSIGAFEAAYEYALLKMEKGRYGSETFAFNMMGRTQ